jgi:beta-lactam-binding protein with PASTA domain
LESLRLLSAFSPSVVFMSLQGAEIKVPEITGKNFIDGEHELAALGLKIKKRADRVSKEPPNTVIEQLPKPGETVKTGQMILVVTSKGAGEGEEVPAVPKKNGDDDDAKKIEEMISDQPKRSKSNTNSNRKKADTTRDVNGNSSNSNSNSNSADGNSNKKEPGSNDNSTTNPIRGTEKPPKHPTDSNTTRPKDSRPRVSNRP